jgi:hypothetical protein
MTLSEVLLPCQFNKEELTETESHGRINQFTPAPAGANVHLFPKNQVEVDTTTPPRIFSAQSTKAPGGLSLRSSLGALDGGHERAAHGNIHFFTTMPEKRLPIIYL